MQTRDLEYDASGVILSGYLACDETQSGLRSGVVLVHDVWGLGDNLKRRARMIADLGYVALAADMYGGRRVATTHPQALEFLGTMSSDPELVRSRGRAALTALAAQPNVDPRRLAAIGYCFGGMVVLEMARAGCDLAGVVSFHGGLQTKLPAAPGSIRPKILACAGGDDPRVPIEQVVAFQDEMRRVGADWQVVTFGGAQHAFTVPESDSWGRPGAAYHAAADRRSWFAMKTFLEEVFGADAAA
jgi:dienelactone hydrolase